MARIFSSMDRYGETLHFLRRLAANPRAVGSVAPSSRFLAGAMAAEIGDPENASVLELGPGTGAVTRAILARGLPPERLWVVEYDAHFAENLARGFQGVHVVHGDAFDLEKTLAHEAGEPFDAILSGLPLLNFASERRRHFIEGVFARLKPGGVFIQFSYGLTAPVAAPKDASLHLAAFVWRNIPPARVWAYRKR